MRRAMGIETEHGLTLVKSNGEFMNPESALWFFYPVIRLVNVPFSEQDPKIKRLLLIRETPPEHRIWSGASGGELYVDHVESGTSGYSSKLEYASPECSSVEDVVWADKGGERILQLLREVLLRRGGLNYRGRSFRDILITKNNCDFISGKGEERVHFYGSHESYLTETLFSRDNVFLETLASLLTSRIPLSGSGGLSRLPGGEWRYVISPIALSTTQVSNSFAGGNLRPLISFRSSSEENVEGTTRLHIPSADSNMMPQAVRFRFALVHTLLRIFELREEAKFRFPLLSSPTEAVHTFSLDPSLGSTVNLVGRRGCWAAWQILQEWLEVLLKFCESTSFDLEEGDKKILQKAWLLVSNSKGNPDAFSQDTDWALKLKLLNDYCNRKKLKSSDWKARRFDVYYSLLGPDGIFNRWRAIYGDRDPFSSEEMTEALWGHHGAPRTELRKRFITAHVKNDLYLPRHGWGNFYHDGGLEVMPDPFVGENPKIEDYISKLLARFETGQRRK